LDRYGVDSLGNAAHYPWNYPRARYADASPEYDSTPLEWVVLVPVTIPSSKRYPLHRFQRCRFLFPKYPTGGDSVLMQKNLLWNPGTIILTVSGLMKDIS
jgi:hypothetical protein